MQHLGIAIRYIRYLQQARNKFDIHPPFLYDLISGVFEDREIYPAYLPVERMRGTLLRDREWIQVTDLGAGSATGGGNRRRISDITRHSSKSRKYGRLLFRIARFLEPDNILELGTSMGISTAYLALGNRRSSVTTIEGCSNIASKARINLDSLGLNEVRILNGNFDKELPGYLGSIPGLGLGFIDGNHREQPTVDYFEQCLAKTVSTSCLIFDDIHWSEGMERAWRHIAGHPDVTLSIDLFQMGIVFFRKELTKQQFTIRF